MIQLLGRHIYSEFLLDEEYFFASDTKRSTEFDSRYSLFVEATLREYGDITAKYGRIQQVPFLTSSFTSQYTINSVEIFRLDINYIVSLSIFLEWRIPSFKYCDATPLKYPFDFAHSRLHEPHF